MQTPHLHVECQCSYLALHAAELSSKLVLQSVGQLVVNWTRHLLLTSLFIQDLQHTEETASVWTLTEEEEEMKTSRLYVPDSVAVKPL